MTRPADITPGAVEAVPVRPDDFVWSGITTIDNRVDDIIGVRPLRTVARVLFALGPANVIRNLTGIPKPSEVIEDFEDRLESRVRGLRAGGPRLPRLF